MSAGSQVIENTIANNGGDGITIKPGAEITAIHDNNITDNEFGLGNESGGGDARRDRSTGGTRRPDRAGSTPASATPSSIAPVGGQHEFLEFLCKPFPQGFPSILGVCSTETAELRQLVPGRNPDLDTFGRYIVFESSGNMDVDGAHGLQQRRLEPGDLPPQPAAEEEADRRLPRRPAAVRLHQPRLVHAVQRPQDVPGRSERRPDRAQRRMRHRHPAQQRRLRHQQRRATAQRPRQDGASSTPTATAPAAIPTARARSTAGAARTSRRRRRRCQSVFRRTRRRDVYQNSGAGPERQVGGGRVERQSHRRQRRRQHRDLHLQAAQRRVGPDHRHRRRRSRESPAR